MMKRPEGNGKEVVLIVYAVARLIICKACSVRLHEEHKKRLLTSLAHRIVFFASADKPRLFRSSLAIHSCNNSCLSWPLGNESARSPIRPNANLTRVSVRSSSERHLWMRSSILCACGSSNPTVGWRLGRCDCARQIVHTLFGVLQTSDNSSIGFQD